MDKRRPTISDVAEAAGVSKALVSIVMRGVPGASAQTRERVTALADRMGYVPDQRARSLRQSASTSIGVTFDLQQPFHGDLVEHLYSAAAQRGYDLVISAVAPTRSNPSAVQALLRERCRVAVLIGSVLPDDDLVALAGRIPTLVVARAGAPSGVGVVRSDDVAGIGLAVGHLVELGHRRIAHIDGGDAPGAADRRAGFLAAAARYGISIDASIVAGGPSETDGAQGVRMLLNADVVPTAVLAFNDRCATGVLDTLVRGGHATPEHMSVVGYDNSRLAALGHIQLTTVSQNAEEMATATVDSALDLIAGGRPREVVLAPKLIVRSTTGAV